MNQKGRVELKTLLHEFGTKIKIHFGLSPVYLFVLICVFPAAYFTDKYLEAIFLIIAFVQLRYKFQTTWHAKSTGVCIFITIAVGYLAIPRVWPIEFSLLSSVIIGFIIDFIAWYAQFAVDLVNENKLVNEENALLKEKIEQEHIDIDLMSDAEFAQYCGHRGLSASEIKIAIAVLKKKLKGQELYDEIGYSMTQSKRLRKKILEKLNMTPHS